MRSQAASQWAQDAVRLLALTLFLGSVVIPAEAQRQTDYCGLASTTRPSLPATLMEGMGRTHLKITTSSAQAQRFFDQGLAQLHAFWFREAERSFLQAAALDPNAAMAHWGVSVSAGGDHLAAFQLPRRRSNQGKPVPAPGSPEARAREAIAKAVALKSKVSDKERLYIEAEAARRNPQSRDVDADYVRGLRKIVAGYPDDVEAKSFLALALATGYHPITKAPGPGTAEAVSIVRGILAADSGHAGAHHYLIHVLEGGRDLGTAVESARRMPNLVPNIPHALHMPGHVLVPGGQYEEAIRAFTAAKQNEEAHMRRDSLYPVAHFAHNQHFLVHVLGIEGRHKEALARVRELLTMRENPREREEILGSSAYRQGYFALVKTLVRFEKWDAILSPASLPKPAKPYETAWYHYARGLALASRKDDGGAKEEYRLLRASMDALQRATNGVPAQLGVAMTELEGYIGARGAMRNRGVEVLRIAVGHEDSLFYNEPPTYPRPVRELLGKVLLDARDFKGAESVYRELLLREPNSGRAFWGLSEALAGLGRVAEAEKARRDFVIAWAEADTDLPETRLRR